MTAPAHSTDLSIVYVALHRTYDIVIGRDFSRLWVLVSRRYG